MDENFDNDLLKAVLSWDGLIGSKMAPRSPNATVLTLLYKMSGLFNGGHGIPMELRVLLMHSTNLLWRKA